MKELLNEEGLFDSHYILIRPLSTDGATADVWLAIDTNTLSEDLKQKDISSLSENELAKVGLVVAIKIYRPQNSLDIEGEQRFRDEYMIVFNCHHTNLIHPTHFSIYKDIPYLVLPYCKLGSSELLIGSKLELDHIWQYILDVSSGLDYLHSLDPPIVHQDIKPANILLDDTHHYAITDFGISSQKGGVQGYHDEENSGTLAYMAPERFREGTEPMPQSDIWAFGATLYEIITGQVPYGEDGGKFQMETDSSIPPILDISEDIQRLICACLALEPGDRPSAGQIVEAARIKQFPLKSKKKLSILFSVICSMLIGVISFLLFFTGETRKEEPLVMTEEDLYAVALQRVNSNNIDSLRTGLSIMDSLSNMDFIPAIYQMAYTYGWYSDSLSIKRKELLGIEIDSSFIPKSDRYSNKAVALLTKIMELNDSSYADINANASYRLACYYVMPNNIYKSNYEKGKNFLLRSKDWAMMAKDYILLEKINKALASFEK